MANVRLGEVIASSTTTFVAEADRLHESPAFGSLVRVAEPGRPAVIAVVYEVSTSSLDPGRRPLARGQPPDRYDERIFTDFPELRETLRTEFTTLVVGHRFGDGPYLQHLPPHPAPLHYSVWACESEERYAFSAQFDYFRTILRSAQIPADELLAAVIRDAAALRQGNADAYLLRAGQALASLLKDEYDRLVTILRHIAPVEVS